MKGIEGGGDRGREWGEGDRGRSGSREEGD